MSMGCLSLILHSHLPFVRHPECPRFLEEDWLLEAISETYLPLLDVFERLEADDIPFRLTVSVSPTLTAMLQDKLLQERYINHLQNLIDLAQAELKRTKNDPELNKLAGMYLRRFENCFKNFTDRYKRNIISRLKYFQSKGYLELITSSATHSFLPLLQNVPKAVKAQIEVAVDSHTEHFETNPEGIWLPECGYFPGVEDYLKARGLKYFFMEAHGILFADQRPNYGVYAPLYCPNMVAAFGRDPESSRAVWSSEEGYPGDNVYREFYRDVGFDLPLEYIEPFIHDGGIRVNTGIKYYAITGRTDQKILYNREKAMKKAEEHAEHFLTARLIRIEQLQKSMDRPPIFVCPYDTELFGHWWFEGPAWIEYLIRKVAMVPDRLKMITASDYLAEYPENQVSTPSFSSWGNKGYAEVWLEGSNDWIYRHLHKASERMVELCRRFPGEKGILRRALNQAARELLLCQASDWAFIMKTGTTVPYAVKRTKEHIYNFNRIYESVMAGSLDKEWLKKIESKNNLFPHIDYRVYA